MKVLIADDHDIFRNVIKYYLTKYNFEITEVADGLAVLKEFKETNYDILFLDIYMPHLNGMNVAKYLKEVGKDTQTDVILISSSIDLDTLLELKKYGVKYFLSKPIDIKSFHHIVEEIMQSKDKKYEIFMQMAIDEAWKYQFLTYPNPAVGAVVVRNNKVLSVEAHHRAGEAHAEVLALKMAYLSRYPDSNLKEIQNSKEIHLFLCKNHENFFRECEIYVTLEPCNHIGKTPACAALLQSVRIKKVYIGTLDPTENASGGEKRLKNAGIAVETDICKDKTDTLLYPFLKFQSGYFTFFKMAMREDGSVDGGQITTQESLDMVHEIRTKIDLMVIGGNTVRIDRPTLDARFATPNKSPDILIYSREKTFDETIPLFQVPKRSVTINSHLGLVNTKKFVMVEGGDNLLNIIERNIDYLVVFISHKKNCIKKKTIENKNFKIEYSYFINKHDEIIFLKKVKENN